MPRTGTPRITGASAGSAHLEKKKKKLEGFGPCTRRDGAPVAAEAGAEPGPG